MRTPLPRMSRRGRMTLLVLAAVIVLFIAVGWLVDIWTDYLWFSEVHYTTVFTTVLWTRIGLFLVFGLVIAGLFWFNLWLAYRLRPMLRPHSAEQASLERYRALFAPRLGIWIGLLAGLVGLFTGLSAQSNWQEYLLFANAQPFGVKDPQFGVDIGFYVFDYPFYRYLLGIGFTLIVLSVLGSVAMHYLFGGVRLQGAGERMSNAARAHLTTLVAFFVALKAIAYFLDQRGLTLGHNGALDIYGAGYTDVNALLPAKEILAWISVVVAVAILIFSNAFIRNLVWPGVAIGLLALSAIAIGGIYPAAVQTITVKPNMRDRENPYIQRSIDATRAAYGLSDVDVQGYKSDASAPPDNLSSEPDTVANIRLLDPSIVSSTYTQLQQVRGFYDFTQKLDIDRYNINGSLKDYVVGIRELDYSNLSGNQSGWQNQHTVYTHGYGFVAAPANQSVCQGQPFFISGFLGDTQEGSGCQSNTDQITVQYPRVYYGEGMGSYVVVGKASQNAPNVEYDRPQGGDQYVTYDGGGGVPISSYWRRILYAYKYKETNFLISTSVFNQNSRILYNRDPLERVKQVAPFLTMDGDPYPAVVDGKIVWILDGYTTASTYPYSQQTDLQSATSDSLVGEGITQQAQQNINYLRNSVKATVDAYTGQVTLYAFDDNDPVLKAWNKAFGGNIIKSSSAIPANLAAHFRYPEDQFKVQRELLTRYHVTDANQFFTGQDFWQVPQDPAPGSAAKQAPYYLLAKFPGQDQTTFQLTSAMVPRKRQNLAALITGSYVDGKPKLEILQLPDDTQVFGPGQVDQKMTSDNGVRPLISSYQISANVIYGNLLSLPVGNGMLYVEPLYQLPRTQNPYPQLKQVLVNFGQYVGFGETLPAALDSLKRAAQAGQASGTPPSGTPSPNPSATPTPSGSASPTPSATAAPPSSNPDLNAATAAIDKALADLKAAQASGDFAAYGRALQELQAAIDQYNKARQGGTSTPSASPTG